MKKLTAIATVLLAGALNAADFYWYTTEGDWNDGSKWHQGSAAGATGIVPGVNDSVHLLFDGVVINVNGEYTVKSLDIPPPATGLTRNCRLVGNGKLTLGSGGVNTSFQVNASTTLVLDGPDVYCAEGVQYCEGGTLIVKKGVYTPLTHYLKTAPGRLVIDGGTVTSEGTLTRTVQLRNGWSGSTSLEPLCFIDLKSGVFEAKGEFLVGTFTMTGGVWDRTKVAQNDLAALATHTGLTIDIQGGDVRLASNDTSTLPQVPTLFNAECLSGSRNYGEFTLTNAPGTFTFLDYSFPASRLMVPCDTVFSGRTLNVSSWAIRDGAHEVTMDLETLRFNESDTFVPALGSDRLSCLPLHVDSPRHITFESAKAGCKAVILSNLQMHNTDACWRFRKGVTFRTTALEDGTSGVTYNFCAPLFDEGATLDVEGVGRTELFFSSYTNLVSRGRGYQDGLSNRLSRVSIGAGATLALSGWAWINRDHTLCTDRFTMGAGAKFVSIAATYGHFEAQEAELDPSAELLIDTPDTANSDFPPSPLALGPKHLNDFASASVRPALTLSRAGATDEWNAEWINGMPVVWRKNKDQRASCYMTRANMSKWRGSADGSWANSANWLVDEGKALADDPLDQSRVFDGGYTNTRVTVDSAEKAYQVRVYNKTAPVAFVGSGSLELAAHSTPSVAATAWDVNCAVVSSSEHPVIFDVPVSLSPTVASERYFTVNGSSRSYIAFMKAVDAGNLFCLRAEVLVGGALTAKNFTAYDRTSVYPARDTRLAVIPGGSVTLTEQNWMQSGATCAIDVYSNACFTVLNANSTCQWGSSVERVPIQVRAGGCFDCRCPLGGSTAAAFRGAGEVRLADTGSKATADYSVTFDGVTFAVGAFASGHPIVLKGSPVWAAMGDWTYDLAPVALPAGNTLTVDTGDLDDASVGHSATIAAALSADGLVKTGEGTLTLGSDANAIGDVKVEAGSLAWTAPQTFASLTLAEGATLMAGCVSPLVVAGDVDLSVGSIAIAPAARGSIGSTWTTLVSVPEGASLVPPALPADSPYRLRVKDTDSGLALQMRLAPGCAIYFR